MLLLNTLKEQSDDKDTMIHKKQHFYLLTIAKHQVLDYVHKSDLDQIMVFLKLKHDSLHVIESSYEISSLYKQLHFHAIVRLSHKIYYKKNNSLKGFRIQWKPIYNWKGAFRYVYKDSSNQYEQEQILVSNYLNHHYAFI